MSEAYGLAFAAAQGVMRADYRRGVLDALASASLKRPWALVGAALAVLAAALAIAMLTTGGLGPGSTRVDEPAGADLVIETEEAADVPRKVSGVALATIAANVEADPAVASVSPAQTRPARGTATMAVALETDDDGARREAVARINADVDPGPLELHVSGETTALLEAGSGLGEDLWRLELLVIPVALLALAGGLGARVGLAAAIAAATAIAGCLAGLGIGGAFADPTLLGAVPGIAVGLALGIELPALMAARLTDEARMGPPDSALRAALADGVWPLAFTAVAGVVASAGMLATGYGPAVSSVVAVALAVGFALLATLLATPALFALELRARGDAEESEARGRLAEALSAAPRGLARRPWRTAVAVVVAFAALLALAYPAHDAQSVPLGVAASDSLLDELPLAAAVSAAALGLAFVLRTRRLRSLVLGPTALLPAGAACGLVALVFEDGTLLPSSAGGAGALSNASVGALAVALAAIGAARTAAATEAVGFERALDPGPPGVAERAATATAVAAVLGTLIAGAAAGVMLGADLRAVQELGLGLAAGLLADLLIARPASLAALARWGAGTRTCGAPLTLRRWTLRRPATRDSAG